MSFFFFIFNNWTESFDAMAWTFHSNDMEHDYAKNIDFSHEIFKNECGSFLVLIAADVWYVDQAHPTQLQFYLLFSSGFSPCRKSTKFVFVDLFPYIKIDVFNVHTPKLGRFLSCSCSTSLTLITFISSWSSQRVFWSVCVHIWRLMNLRISRGFG